MFLYYDYAGSDTETFGTLVTCLKHAKTLGVVKDILEVKDGLEVKDRLGVMDRLEAKQDDVTLWNGIIAVSMLEQALVHQDEQVSYMQSAQCRQMNR